MWIRKEIIFTKKNHSPLLKGWPTFDRTIYRFSLSPAIDQKSCTRGIELYVANTNFVIFPISGCGISFR